MKTIVKRLCKLLALIVPLLLLVGFCQHYLFRANNRNDLRLLGFRASAQPLMRAIRKRAFLPLITKPARGSQYLAEDARAEIRRYSDLALEAVKGLPCDIKPLSDFSEKLVGRAK